MDKALKIVLGLYAISLLTSMAGMELFGWLSAIFGLALYVKAKIKKVKASKWAPFKLMSSLWLFLSVIAISTLFIVEDSHNKIGMLGSLRWALLLPLLVHSFQQVSFKSQEKFFLYLVYIAGAVGLYAFVQHYIGQDFFRSEDMSLVHSSKDHETRIRFWRSKGFFNQPLTYAYVLGMFVCFPIAQVLGKESKASKLAQWGMGLSALVIVASIVTTYSRGGWIAFGGALTFLIFKNLNKKQLLYFCLGTAVAGTVVLISSLTLRTRVMTIFDPAYGSNSERFHLWAANWEMFKEYPFFGVGWNLNKVLVAPYLESLGYMNHFVSHAHNTYVQLLAGTGLLGFLSLVSFFGVMFVLPIKLYRDKSVSPWVGAGLMAAVAAQINLHIGGLSECNFTDAEVTHQTVFVWAWVISVYLKDKDSEL